MSHFALLCFEIGVSKAVSHQCQKKITNEPFRQCQQPQGNIIKQILKIKYTGTFLFQDKRKIQEEISQKRLKIEEDKLKHQHLKVIYGFNFISMIFVFKNSTGTQISIVKKLQERKKISR